MTRYTFLLLLMLTVPAAAQPRLVFESEPGLRLASLSEPVVAQQSRFDYDGDGVRDLAVVRGNGTADTLVVMSLTTLETIASLSLSDVEQAFGGMLSSSTQFLGFVDLDGDGVKEGGVYDRENQMMGLLSMSDGGATTSFVVAASSVALIDLDGDAQVELVAGNPATETAQVYASSSTDTATETYAAALAPLLESYPNPFREAATIAYEVDQPGAVSLTVYDILGRRVRTLVDADQPGGAYEVRWDGRDAAGQRVASGTYVYHLRVGEAVASKQAVRLQ